jgi:hypothetical protein
MITIHTEYVSVVSAKRIGDLKLSTRNSDNRCKNCNAFLIYDFAILDCNGKCVPLDLNHKRHFCTDAERIVHESAIVKNLQPLLEDTNKTELLSFELEPRIADGVKG